MDNKDETRVDLEASKLRVEIRKIEAEWQKSVEETRHLRTPWLKRPGTWAALVPAALGIATIWFTWYSGFFATEHKLLEIKKIDLAHTEEKIATRQADLSRTEEEIIKREADLSGLQKRAEKLERQLKDAETQARIAKAFRLALEAEQLRNEGPRLEESVRRALQSMEEHPSPQAYHALSRGLTLLPRPLSRLVHKAKVGTVVFCPDGEHVITAEFFDEDEDDKPQRWWRWKLDDGKEEHREIGKHAPNRVAVSESGEYVVTSSEDGIRLWREPSHTEVKKVDVPKPPSAVAVSDSGRFAAAMGRSIVVWQADGSELDRFGSQKNVDLLILSPDGKYVAARQKFDKTEDKTNTVDLRTVGHQRPIKTISHEDKITSVAFSRDSQLFAAGSWDNTAGVYDCATGEKTLKIIHNGNVNAVTFDKSGQFLATGSSDMSARVWELSTGRLVAYLAHESTTFHADAGAAAGEVASASPATPHGDHDPRDVHSVAFSPDGTLLATSTHDHTARVWVVATGREFVRMVHKNVVWGVAFSSEGRYLATASDDGTVRLWEVIGGGRILLDYGQPVWSLAFSKNGEFLAAGYEKPSYAGKSTVRVWDLASGQKLTGFEQPHRAMGVAFTPDSNRLAAASADFDPVLDLLDPRSVSLYDVSNGENSKLFDYQHAVFDVAISDDGRHLAMAGFNGYCAWDLRSQEKKEEGYLTSFSVALSPNGEYLAIGGHDGTVRVSALEAKEPVKSWATSSSEVSLTVYDLAFSPDGRYLAIAAAGTEPKSHCNALVWEWKTAEEPTRLEHPQDVLAVAFSPGNGQLLATGGLDKMIRIWEWASKNEKARIRQRVPAYAVAFSPDAKYIAMQSGVWLWRTEDLKNEARARLTTRDK